jgi:hypothetical protein
MVENPLGDDIAAKIEAGDRIAWRMVWVLIGPTVLLIAAFATAFVTGQTTLLQSEAAQIVIGVLFAACIVYAASLVRRRFRPDIYVDASDPRIIRRRIDAHQRSWRLSLCVGILSTFPSFLSLGVGFNRLEHANRLLALAAGGTLIVTTALLLGPLMIGPGWLDRGLRDILNDEFMRDLRGRAMRLGYLIMVVAVAAALMATIWRPDFALASLAWALYAGFAIPALYYVIADWRASRDG